MFASAMFLMFALMVPSIHASMLVTGNGGNESSFTFPVSAHAFDDVNGIFYVAALNDVTTTGSQYSISSAFQNAPFTPLALEKIISGTQKIDNPLLGKAIAHMSLLTESVGLGLVGTGTPSTLFLLHTIIATGQTTQRSVPFAGLEKLMTVTGIHDADGQDTAGIVGLVGVQQGKETHNFIAAVKKNGGDFGEVGGGLAYIAFDTTATTGDITTTCSAKNANTGELGGNLALPLDPTTVAAKINSDLSAIQANVVDLHFDAALNRFYVALQATSGAGATDGVRSLLMGRFSAGGIALEPIAPDAVFSGTNKIVGATGSNVEVSLFKVRTLHTSSRLSYVVVVGGNGNTGNTVYALPLVDKRPIASVGYASDLQHGTLAKWDADPVDSFFGSYPSALRYRGNGAAATTETDVLTSGSPQALVGGGVLPLASSQRVTDIIARNDAIYVSIGDEFDATTSPGIFTSQAILDEKGRITAWTPWQRAGGTDQKIFGAALDSSNGNMWYMTGDLATTVSSIFLTKWSNGAGDGLLGGDAGASSLGLVGQLQEELPTNAGGINGVFDFARTTSGFGDEPATVNNQLSMLVITGLNKIVLVEAARNAASNIFRANTGDFATGKQIFTDGTLTGFVSSINTKMIAISGGAVQTIGPITSAEVSRVPLSGATTNGYLFIGGAHGLAVLSRADNSGWDTSSPSGGLHAGFIGLEDDMSFKVIGSYTNIRKLISDGTYLYVLTNTKLDRITISSIAGGSPTIVTVANLDALNLPAYASLSDVAVSDKFGLLATGGGLFRVGNDKDITDAGIANPYELAWTQVAMPEGLGVVTRLLTISPTGQELGFARNGMIYALSGSVATRQSRVHRFFVSDVASGAITDTTIQLLNDLYIRDVPSFFVELGSYHNFIATDGAVLFNTLPGNQVSGPALSVLYVFKVGERYSAKNSNQFVANSAGGNLMPVSPASSVRQLVRSSASGAWLLGGGAGLMVNE